MWLKTAFSINNHDSNEYYIVTDPIEFLEIKFTGIIPKGIEVNNKLPRSDAFIGGKIIAVANIPSDFIEKGQIKQDIHTNINLKIGEVQSTTELYSRFIHLKNEFNRDLDTFKKTCLSQKYILSKNDKPYLCIIEGDDQKAVIKRLCPVVDLLTKIQETRDKVLKDGRIKIGRAYEHYDLRKLENLVTYISNKSMPIDVSKIEWFLKRAKMEPQSSEETSWLKCYTSINPVASDTYDRMQKFTSLRWVRDIIGPSFVQDYSEKKNNNIVDE